MVLHDLLDPMDRPVPRGGHVMEVQTRRMVWHTIRSRPGVNKTELAHLTGLSWGSVGHHLHMLERDGVIRLVRVGRTVHATPTEFADRLRRTPILICPDARRVLGALLTQPFSRGTTDLGRLLGMTRKQARRHVYELVRAGLVEGDGSYHPSYRATRRGCTIAESLAILDLSSRETVAEPLTIGQ